MPNQQLPYPDALACVRLSSHFAFAFCLLVLSSLWIHQSAGQTLSFTKITTDAIATNTANSQGASWVDYDNDGYLDLFVSNVGSAPNFLYKNAGDGMFTQVSSGSLATDRFSNSGNCWADVDNDGDVDVFASGSAAAFYLNDGQGAFTRQTNLGTFGTTDLRSWACAWADYDQDGFVDLVLTHPQGFLGTPHLSNLFFRNNQDGTFTAIQDSPITMGLAPYTVPSWSDFDLDGDMDLFIGSGPASSSRGPDFFYKNLLTESGSATFERIEQGALASTLRDGQIINWVDYDNDLDLDAFITNWGGNLGGGLGDELYRNDEGTFTRITSQPLVNEQLVSLASVWGDFDNDTDLDVFIADGSSGRTNRFYENKGDGTFTRLNATPFSSDASVSWGASAGDYDNDGDLDLYVANALNGSRNFLYRNDLDSTNNWIKVKLIGTISNHSAIGAKVRIQSNSADSVVHQIREVSSQNSFNGHNSLVVHFGLAEAQEVDSLQIEWPSGEVEKFANLNANEFLVITEQGALGRVSSDRHELQIESITLHQNYPNPFGKSTTLSYTLPHDTHARLSVFNILGQELTTLVDGYQTAGHHSVQFKPASLPNGLYIYRLQLQNSVLFKTMLLQQ